MRSEPDPFRTRSIYFLRNTREIVAATYDVSGVHVIDPANGRRTRSFQGFKAFAVSPDDRWLATTRQEAETRLFVYDLASGKVLHERDANPDKIWVAAFSPDGRWLATGGMLGSLLVWDTTTFDHPRRFQGHRNWINRMDFSPDSKLLATSSDDRTVRVWSLEDGRTRLLFRADSPVVPVRFTPDGTAIAMGDGHVVRLYDVDFSVWDEDATVQLERAEREAGARLRGVEAVPAD